MMRPISLINRDTMKDKMPVILEDNETYLDMYKDNKNVKTIIINNNGLTPKIIPPDVATALPPLKRAKIGYVCPMTANIPIISRYTSTSKSRGTSVATVPFSISDKTTML